MATYELRNPRKPRSADELTPLDLKRLPVCGQRYDGKKLTLKQRLALGPDAVDALRLPDQFSELWEVYRDGKHTHDVWLYAVDSGTIFHAGTTRIFGEVIQFGFGGPGGEPNPEAEAMEAAYKQARAKKAKARPRKGRASKKPSKK